MYCTLDFPPIQTCYQRAQHVIKITGYLHRTKNQLMLTEKKSNIFPAEDLSNLK